MAITDTQNHGQNQEFFHFPKNLEITMKLKMKKLPVNMHSLRVDVSETQKQIPTPEAKPKDAIYTPQPG